jgi:hypothetical protein
LCRTLNFKLKIPRHHAEFLEKEGALEHFVKAKADGDELVAKWSLLKAGKSEI